jgi:hypothetical protein
VADKSEPLGILRLRMTAMANIFGLHLISTNDRYRVLVEGFSFSLFASLSLYFAIFQF